MGNPRNLFTSRATSGHQCFLAEPAAGRPRRGKEGLPLCWPPAGPCPRSQPAQLNPEIEWKGEMFSKGMQGAGWGRACLSSGLCSPGRALHSPAVRGRRPAAPPALPAQCAQRVKRILVNPYLFMSNASKVKLYTPSTFNINFAILYVRSYILIIIPSLFQTFVSSFQSTEFPAYLISFHNPGMGWMQCSLEPAAHFSCTGSTSLTSMVESSWYCTYLRSSYTAVSRSHVIHTQQHIQIHRLN